MPNIAITKPGLIWPGKYDEEGRRIINRGVALPFKVVDIFGNDTSKMLAWETR